MGARSVFMQAALTGFTDAYPDSWDRHLDIVAFPYSVSELAGLGVSPFQLLFGRKPRLPVDLLAGLDQEEFDMDERAYGLNLTRKLHELHARFTEVDAEYRQKYRKARYRNRFEVFYEVGDQVLIWTPPRASAMDRALDHDTSTGTFPTAAPFNKKLHYQWRGPYSVVRPPQ